MQHLDKMKSLEDVYGQAIALENIAKTYEYMANLTKACESLEQVRTVDCKYFVLKIFRVQKFNFCGWSQP